MQVCAVSAVAWLYPHWRIVGLPLHKSEIPFFCHLQNYWSISSESATVRFSASNLIKIWSKILQAAWFGLPGLAGSQVGPDQFWSVFTISLIRFACFSQNLNFALAWRLLVRFISDSVSNLVFWYSFDMSKKFLDSGNLKFWLQKKVFHFGATAAQQSASVYHNWARHKA